MKPYITYLIFFLSIATFTLRAQELTEVEAKGVGINKNDALQDALRNAVGQAAGVVLKSETRVENYMVISDAIATNIDGYVKKYTVISEIPFPDRFEVKVKAEISTSPMKADFQLLARSIGGVRFLVMVDPRVAKGPDAANYDYAVQRINAHLAENKYRYIDKSRFESLRKEAMNMMEESDTSISYVQRLGIMADAQFIILLSDINTTTIMGAFDIPRGTKVNLVAKAYDNCTGEGLGTIILESSAKTSVEGAGFRSALDEAVKNDFNKLLYTFNSYIGSWINNGTPFELRFYNTGTYRDFRDLRTKLKNDSNFGGDLEITSAYNYTKLNCTFRNKADDLADKVLDFADEIPSMASKRLDVKLIYGRQISFAPQNYIIPDLVKPEKDSGSGSAAPATTHAKPTTTTGTEVNTTPTTKPTTPANPNKICNLINHKNSTQ